ncbi:hypothetical protein E2562_038927 [Oryza meyeriana var. granulata]|uniref:Uncharacterized protein n=1 Tax=Oryza meyeriana var. granulata TaxID=110450 RepID=A0A6G1DTT4_9ORYZ|nr:hypothetical protein E2562_038927 [Oryza meyeriana var. granulata]
MTLKKAKAISPFRQTRRRMAVNDLTCSFRVDYEKIGMPSVWFHSEKGTLPGRKQVCKHRKSMHPSLTISSTRSWRPVKVELRQAMCHTGRHYLL